MLVHIQFCVKTLRLGTVSVCLARSSRYVCCVDCLCCDLDICFVVSMKMETEDHLNLKYGVFRIKGRKEEVREGREGGGDGVRRVGVVRAHAMLSERSEPLLPS